MKMLDEPRTRLAQPRFAPHVVKPQHEIYFVIADLRHRASPLISSRTPASQCHREREMHCPRPCHGNLRARSRAAGIPAELVAGARGILLPGAWARFVIAVAACMRRGRTPGCPKLAARRSAPASMRDRHGAQPMRPPAPVGCDPFTPQTPTAC